MCIGTFRIHYWNTIGYILVGKGINYSNCVFKRRPWLHRFRRCENVATTNTHFLSQMLDLVSNFLWRGELDGTLATKATPECNLVPILLFELVGIHPGCLRLHTFEHVESDFNNIGHDTGDAATAVGDDDLFLCMHRIVDCRPTWFEEFAPSFWSKDNAALISPVVSEHNCVGGNVSTLLHH